MRNIERSNAIGWDQESKERRARQRRKGAEYLSANNIAFYSNNGGAHIVVQHNGIDVDYWPGTGRWVQRGPGGKNGRGIFGLLKLLGVNVEPDGR